MVENKELNDLILYKLEELSEHPVESDEFKKGAEALAKLLERKHEHDKIEFDKDKFEQEIEDTKIKFSQEQLKIISDIATKVSYVGLLALFGYLGLYLEEHGSMNSPFLRTVYNKIIGLK